MGGHSLRHHQIVLTYSFFPSQEAHRHGGRWSLYSNGDRSHSDDAMQMSSEAKCARLHWLNWKEHLLFNGETAKSLAIDHLNVQVLDFFLLANTIKTRSWKRKPNFARNEFAACSDSSFRSPSHLSVELRPLILNIMC